MISDISDESELVRNTLLIKVGVPSSIFITKSTFCESSNIVTELPSNVLLR